MADIHVVNTATLHDFSVLLFDLSQNMVENFTRANIAAQYVSEGWQDKQNEQFMDNFAQAIDAINRIAEVLNNHAEYVRHYADYLDGASLIK